MQNCDKIKRIFSFGYKNQKEMLKKMENQDNENNYPFQNTRRGGKKT